MTCRRLLTVPAVVLAAAVVLAGRVAPGQPMDWPRWRGPNADGISTESAWTTDWPDTGPPVAWQAQVGEGFSGVAVAAGRLYTMGFLRDENAKPTDSEKAAGHDAVWCLDAATGAVVWKHAYPAAKGYYYGPFMTPTVEGDRVFTLGKAGDLVCLDAATGKVVWRRHLVDDLSGKMPYYGYACAPLVVGDLLVLDVGDPRGPLVALDTTSGRPAWQAGRGSGSYCCPVAYDAGGTTAVAMLLPAAAIGVRADTGKLLWKHPWETGPNSSVTTPVVHGGRVFISASEAKQLAVLLDVTGPAPKALWKNKNMMNYFNASVLWEGHLYGVHSLDHHSKNSSLRCVAWDTGEVRWDQAGVGLGGLVLAGGRLVILEEAGSLVVAEARPDRYTELARAKVLDSTCWAPPVLCRGRIYCRNHRGVLVCVDVRRK